MKTRPFSKIGEALQEVGYQSNRGMLVENAPVEHLVVFIGTDDREQDYFLQLLFITDLQELIPDRASLDLEVKNDYLQFYCELPFKIKQEAVAELAQLILKVNHKLPVGYFGINAESAAIYCRQILPVPDGRVDIQAVVVTVEGMAVAIEEHYPNLFAVATCEEI